MFLLLLIFFQVTPTTVKIETSLSMGFPNRSSLGVPEAQPLVIELVKVVKSEAVDYQ